MKSVRVLCTQYLDVPGTFDVLAVVAPVSGAAEPFCAQLALEYSGHLDTILGLAIFYETRSQHSHYYLEHVAAVRDQILNHTQAGIPVFSARKILNKYFYTQWSRSSALTLDESHSKH